jgi:hypothetical protein
MVQCISATTSFRRSYSYKPVNGYRSKRRGGVELVRVEKEGGRKEGCIHKSLSLGIVVRYQGIEKKEERCVVCKSKEDGKEKGGKEGVTENSEYAGLNSIACKHTEGRKAVKR